MERLLRLRGHSTYRHLLKMYEEDEDLLETLSLKINRPSRWLEMYSNISDEYDERLHIDYPNNPQYGDENVGGSYDYFGGAHNHIQPVGNECGVAIPGWIQMDFTK